MPAGRSPTARRTISGEATDKWLRKAFTSDTFAADNDAFRYVCYTNRRVADINEQIRYWLYGETPTRSYPGEKALLRSPVLRGCSVILATNEEILVEDIEPGLLR